MTESVSRSEYIRHYEGQVTSHGRHKEALRWAHDIRRFEIDLYWKRAAYFWTFIAAALAGYFVLQQKTGPADFESTYLVTCLGFIFSLAWYLANRGSTSWQRNWEAQVDLLEDEVTGPLYKSQINRFDSNLWDLTAGYHFSPSRINQLLGVIITLVWVGLALRTLVPADLTSGSSKVSVAVMSVVTLLACSAFWVWGRAPEPDGERRIQHTMRAYVD